jgi:hypothetical protein
LTLDSERFHRLVDRVRQFSEELSPQLMGLPRRQQQPIAGPVSEGRRDHFQVRADQPGQILDWVWKSKAG